MEKQWTCADGDGATWTGDPADGYPHPPRRIVTVEPGTELWEGYHWDGPSVTLYAHPDHGAFYADGIGKVGTWCCVMLVDGSPDLSTFGEVEYEYDEV